MATDGILTGTPTTAGSYPITITATNGIAPETTLNTSITVTGGDCTGSLCGSGSPAAERAIAIRRGECAGLAAEAGR